jgi:hypothetical protein
MAGVTKPKSDISEINEMTNHFTGVQVGTNTLETKHKNGVSVQKDVGK